MKKTGMLFCLFIICFFSCDKEQYTPIPYYPVYVTLNLGFLDNDLVPVLATKSIIEPRVGTDKLGYAGILVINGYSSDGNINLFAFDLACPVEVDREIKIIPDETGNATCPQCNEVYNIGSGTGIPTKGISKHALRQYRVGNSGGNRFLISN